jgi:hypothetical protein
MPEYVKYTINSHVCQYKNSYCSNSLKTDIWEYFTIIGSPPL